MKPRSNCDLQASTRIINGQADSHAGRPLAVEGALSLASGASGGLCSLTTAMAPQLAHDPRTACQG